MTKQRRNKKSRRESLRENQENHHTRIKEKSKTTGKGVLDLSNFENVKFFKMKKGIMEIDIIPYDITSDNHPQGIPKGGTDYVLCIWTHRNVGVDESSWLCLKRTFNKACPICEERDILIEGGKDWKDKEVKALKPSERCIYNVFDINDNEYEGIKLLESSVFEFEDEIRKVKEIKEEDGEGVLTISDFEDGRTVKFEGIEREGDFKNAAPRPEKFRLIKRDPYNEEEIMDVPPPSGPYPLDAMLIIPTYDEVKNAFHGIEEEEEETESKNTEEAETKPRTRAKRIERKSKHACPANGEFGEDTDTYKDCEDCNVWEACADKKDGGKG
jgi:hypothetical protein